MRCIEGLVVVMMIILVMMMMMIDPLPLVVIPDEACMYQMYDGSLPFLHCLHVWYCSM